MQFNSLLEENINEKFSINSKKLHDELKVGRDYSNWIKGRIKKYGFEENIDYYLSNCNDRSPKRASGQINILRGEQKIEYFITIGMAKELCMIENNEIGRKIRKYFISMEEIAVKSIEDKTQILLEENDGLKKKLDMLIHDENCYLARHIASELGVTAQTLNKVLHMAKVQFQADHVWIPYAKYSNDGIIKTRQMLIGPKVIYHSKWTSKGREFIKTNWQNWCKVYLVQKFLQDKQPNLFNQGE